MSDLEKVKHLIDFNVEEMRKKDPKMLDSIVSFLSKTLERRINYKGKVTDDAYFSYKKGK